MQSMYTRRTFVTLAAGVAALGLGAGMAWQRGWGATLWNPLLLRVTGRRTVEEVMDSMSNAAFGRLQPALVAAGFGEALPPKLRFVALKEERLLELWGERNGFWQFIKTYPVFAASGTEGPKLQEGDRQVPEGHYRITHLNPNSAFHLSLGIDYPNPADREQAIIDGRQQLGGDIMVHGKAVSVGCLAIGDEAIEEIFALVARVGTANSDILIAPYDLRVRHGRDDRSWVTDRYAELTETLQNMAP